MPPSKPLSAVPNTRGPIRYYDTRISNHVCTFYVRGTPYIIRIHEGFFEPPIRLPNPLAIIHVQASQRVDLITQVLGQRFRKPFNKTLDLPTIILAWQTRPRVLLKLFESRREGAMLFDILLHDSRDSRYLLDAGEEEFFLGVVVVVHGFAPALDVCQEVLDDGFSVLAPARDVRGLEVDGV